MGDERLLTVGISGAKTGLALGSGSIMGDLTPDGNTFITLAPTDIDAKDDRLGSVGSAWSPRNRCG